MFHVCISIHVMNNFVKRTFEFYGQTCFYIKFLLILSVERVTTLLFMPVFVT